jgi:hypothetical protein
VSGERSISNSSHRIVEVSCTEGVATERKGYWRVSSKGSAESFGMR